MSTSVEHDGEINPPFNPEVESILGYVDRDLLHKAAEYSPVLGSIVKQLVEHMISMQERITHLEKEARLKNDSMLTWEKDMNGFKQMIMEVKTNSSSLKQVEEFVGSVKEQIQDITSLNMNPEEIAKLSSKLNETTDKCNMLQRRVNMIHVDDLRDALNHTIRRVDAATEGLKQFQRVNSHLKKLDKESVNLMKQMENYNANSEQVASKAADKEYCERRFADLTAQCHKIHLMARKEDLDKLKAEILAVEKHSSANANSGTAAGRRHYRCLTCDRVSPSLNGPSTESFRLETNTENIVFHKGRETSIVGRDNAVYRGMSGEAIIQRSPPTVRRNQGGGGGGETMSYEQVHRRVLEEASRMQHDRSSGFPPYPSPSSMGSPSPNGHPHNNNSPHPHRSGSSLGNVRKGMRPTSSMDDGAGQGFPHHHQVHEEKGQYPYQQGPASGPESNIRGTAGASSSQPGSGSSSRSGSTGRLNRPKSAHGGRKDDVARKELARPRSANANR